MGGDCLECMADSGDPDCIESMLLITDKKLRQTQAKFDTALKCIEKLNTDIMEYDWKNPQCVDNIPFALLVTISNALKEIK